MEIFAFPIVLLLSCQKKILGGRRDSSAVRATGHALPEDLGSILSPPHDDSQVTNKICTSISRRSFWPLLAPGLQVIEINTQAKHPYT